MSKKYGIYIGRLQPMHLGHQQIIDTIISDGLEPVIVLGSAQESRTNKNPLTVEERKHAVRLVYPNISIIKVNDNTCWDSWHESLMQALSVFGSQDSMTIYTHSKPEDLKQFEFRGVQYDEQYYTHVFHVDGMDIKNVADSNFQVRATMIRQEPEKYKHYVDPRVYNYIKELTCQN